MRFRDRREAGAFLASRLMRYAGRPDVLGFRDVHARHGGFEAWVRAGQPVEPRVAAVEA